MRALNRILKKNTYKTSYSHAKRTKEKSSKISELTLHESERKKRKKESKIAIKPHIHMQKKWGQVTQVLSNWWLSMCLDLVVAFCVYVSSSSFFSTAAHAFKGTNGYCSWIVVIYCWLFNPFYQSCEQCTRLTNFTFQ